MVVYFSNHFITNFPQNASENFFENWSIFREGMDRSLQFTSFLANPVGL